MQSIISQRKIAGRSSQLEALWKGVFEKKKIVKQGLFVLLKTNLALPFFVPSVYGVQKTYQGPQILNDIGPSTHGCHIGLIWYKSDCHIYVEIII